MLLTPEQLAAAKLAAEQAATAKARAFIEDLKRLLAHYDARLGVDCFEYVTVNVNGHSCDVCDNMGKFCE
jgi:cyclopropane fatty-acyl-phospholipid synthase-like methyltransferase